MFNAVKLNGDKIDPMDMSVSISANDILGVYPVVKRCDEDGDRYYEVSDQPDGKLLVFKSNGFNKPCSIYIRNDVETSCLVDLL